jgi:hypothetical protein
LIPLKQLGPAEIIYPGFVSAVASQEFGNDSRPSASTGDQIVSEEEAENQPPTAAAHSALEAQDTDNQI